MQKPKTKSIRSVRDILAAGPHAKLLVQHDRHQQLLGLVRQQLPPALASHCLNAQQQGETLIVHADSPVWANKLRFQLGNLQALQQIPAFQAVRQVQVRVLPTSETPTTARDPVSTLSNEAEDIIRKLAEAISDDDLRASWLRIADRKKPHA